VRRHEDRWPAPDFHGNGDGKRRPWYANAIAVGFGAILGAGTLLGLNGKTAHSDAQAAQVAATSVASQQQQQQDDATLARTDGAEARRAEREGRAHRGAAGEAMTALYLVVGATELGWRYTRASIATGLGAAVNCVVAIAAQRYVAEIDDGENRHDADRSRRVAKAACPGAVHVVESDRRRTAGA
jgi:hypothetical protein